MACYEGLNGVNRQKSNGQKFNREPSKKLTNFPINHQKSKLILTAKKFLGTSNLTFFADLNWASSS